MERVDILVVGGGPAGLATARAAAKAGSVLVVHRDAAIGYPVRTSGGSWLADVQRLGLPPECYKVINHLLMAGPAQRAEFAFACDKLVVLDVTATYRYLASAAQEAGARIACGTTFLKVIKQDSGGVTCAVRCGTQVQEVSAKFIVDASGSTRAVLRDIGAGHQVTRFGVGAEYEFEDLATAAAPAVLFVGERFAPAGYGWVFPAPHQRVRVGIGVIRPDTNANPGAMLDAFLASSAGAALGLHPGKLLEKHTGVVPADGPTRPLVHGRVVGVGDAVCQVLPLLGEGIRYCIDSGASAGAALAGALRAPAAWAQHLAGYATWWEHTHGRSFALAQRINHRLGAFHDRQWDPSIEFLSALSDREVRLLLRMEVRGPDALRFWVRHPIASVTFLKKMKKSRRASGSI